MRGSGGPDQEGVRAWEVVSSACPELPVLGDAVAKTGGIRGQGKGGSPQDGSAGGTGGLLLGAGAVRGLTRGAGMAVGRFSDAGNGREQLFTSLMCTVRVLPWSVT